MTKNIHVIAAMLCMASYAVAGTHSIGTASAHGDMRVDGYTVNGDATLFDGSVVNTEQASADLRLGDNVEITMASDSRGTLYHDRIVLQQGASELTASSPFQLQAGGIRVSPIAPNSHGLVSLQTGNTVEVSALTGGFKVMDDHGTLLASVRPGLAHNFAIQKVADATGQSVSSAAFSGIGMVFYENGHFCLIRDTGGKYELTGKDFQKYEGDVVEVSGTQVAGAQAGGIAGVIAVSTIMIQSGSPGGGVPAGGTTGMSDAKKALLGAAIVGAIDGTAVGLFIANEGSAPASR